MTRIGLLGGADGSSAVDPLGGLYFGKKIGVLSERSGYGPLSAPDDYFALIRKIHDSIAIPPQFVGNRRQFSASPSEINRSFEQPNPGLTDSAIAQHLPTNLDTRV